MPTIWNVALVTVIFGAALLLIGYEILKMARNERSKRMGILFLVLVLTGITLMVLGIELLRAPCANSFGVC